MEIEADMNLGNSNLTLVASARELAFHNLNTVKKRIDPVTVSEREKSIPTCEEWFLKSSKQIYLRPLIKSTPLSVFLQFKRLLYLK